MPELPNILLGWLDIETTGLDYENDFILEIAWGFTDYLGSSKLLHQGQFRSAPNSAVHVKSMLTVPSSDLDTLHGVLDRMVNGKPFVRRMHEENGLWNELFLGKKLPRASIWSVIETITHEAITLGKHFEEVRFAGSNVGFDKRFIETATGSEVPGFSHRIHDLSSFRPFFKWQDMDLDNFTTHLVEGTHRAAADVTRDILQWRGIAQAVRPS